MKKKVAYGLGVVGLAPAAALMMPNATAVAAPGIATHAPKAGTKTMSLAFTNTAAATGCTGDSYVSKNTPYSRLWLWHTSYIQSQCIGTVKASTSAYITSFRVRIYHGDTGGPVYSHVRKYTSGLPRGSGSIGVHERFADPVRVCDAWGAGAGFAFGECLTVG